MDLKMSDQAALMYMQQGMAHGHLIEKGIERHPPSREGILQDGYLMAFMRSVAQKNFSMQGLQLRDDINHTPVESVLDIGCGIGLCSLSYYHVATLKPSIWLCDGGEKLEGDETTFCQSFSDGTNLVSDIRVTLDMMLTNGVPQEKVNCIGPSPENIANLKSIDLVVSNVSWFYHYPPEVYWDAVRSVMHRNSMMRVDIRVGPYSDPHPEYILFLRDQFEEVKSLRTTGVPGRPNKTLTVLAKRPKG